MDTYRGTGRKVAGLFGSGAFPSPNMSNKRGPGRFVAAHQTEAARRALIQPVPCWEYKWVIPPGMPSGSTLRLRQWVKTNKKQVSTRLYN